MYVNEKLKLNKFRLVAIPRPSQMFARFGVSLSKGSNYSPDEVVIQSSKIDSISRMSRENDLELYREYQKSLESSSADSNESNV